MAKLARWLRRSPHLLLFSIACLPAIAASAAATDAPYEAVLELRINGQPAGETLVVLRDAGSGLWVEEADLKRLRVQLPRADALDTNGRRYFPIHAISHSQVSIDSAEQSAAVSLPASAFLGTTFSGKEHSTPAWTAAAWGGFVNYDIYGERSDYQDSTGGFSELGVFSPYGVLTNTAIASSYGVHTGAARLETTYTRDFPDRMQSLRIGDAISAPGSWGRAVRFGGLQWGTNFSTRPDLITVPLLAAAGEAVVPSTVDVFVNNQQVSSQQVPPGPFIIDRLPTITGSGNVRLVVRDALGREQLITVPFYSATALLQPGLSDFSMELGAIREDFTARSMQYGDAVLSLTYRRGLLDWFTVEGHAEAQRNAAHAGGVSMAMRAGQLGVFDATAAAGADKSYSGSHSGVLYGAGFERVGDRISFALRTQVADDGFRQVGDLSLILRPQQRTFAQASINLRTAGSLAFAVAKESFADQPARRVLTLSHSISLGDYGFLSVTASRTHSDRDSTDAFLVFTVPLQRARTASLSARRTRDAFFDESEVTASLQQSPPLGNGYGYRLSTASSGNYNADWIAQFDAAAVELQAARFGDARAQRATLTGGASMVEGYVQASRSVQDSFALVEVAGVADLTVYLDNQPITRTDRNGYALVRNLRAYEQNRISIDPADLPLDTAIDSRLVAIAPPYRSGAKVLFPVARERGATFNVVLPGGQPIPAGADVMLGSKRYPVALEGLVFVDDLDHGMPATAQWQSGKCTFRVPPPPAGDPLPDLGKLQCTPLAP